MQARTDVIDGQLRLQLAGCVLCDASGRHWGRAVSGPAAFRQTSTQYLDLVNLVLGRLVLSSLLPCGLHQSLTILTNSITPLDVLVRGLVQVLLNVVEGVLRHVGNAQVGVLPDSALSGLSLTGQHLRT